MKKRMMLTLLLGVLATGTVQGHRHNVGALPEALADSLNHGQFQEGANLFAEDGDLLLSSEFQRLVGPKQIGDALKEKYKGWTIAFRPDPSDDVRFWPVGEAPDTANLWFVNWVYTLTQSGHSHKELFVAIARKKGSHDPQRETHLNQEWLFLTVRRLSLPLSSPEQ
jgi:hypothetical protein